MSLRTRLALGFTAIALLLAVPLLVALRGLQQAQAATDDLRRHEGQAALVLSRIRVGTQQLQRSDLRMSVRPENEALQELLAEKNTMRVLADSLRRLRVPYLLPLVRQIDSSSNRLELWAPVQLQRALVNPEAGDSVSDLHIRPAIAAIVDTLGPAERLLSVRASEIGDDTSRDVSNAMQMGLILFAVTGIGVVTIGVWLTRSVSRPIEDLERGMAEVAGGSFNHQLQVAAGRGDEFGRLATSYREMADRLAELDRLKAEFVSVASHELKTPINVILGYVTLLEEELYGPVNQQQREVLGTVEGQARSLGRLVQHLLDVSRFQAGAGRLELRPVALRPFFGEVERSYRVLAQQRELAFTVALQGPLPEVVGWDRDRMIEVMGNLLSNACKFTAPGGRVDVTVTALPGERGDERLHVEVRDTGAGIPGAELPHLFGKFYQADNQVSGSAGGTGLGLAISKEIVEAHGGTITVDSTVGVGSRFSVVVPVRAVPGTTARGRRTAAAVPSAAETRPSGAAAPVGE